MKQSDIYKLHQKYAHGKYKKEILEIVWTHSLIVKNISLQIADELEKKYGIKTDKKLIEIGALLHDIGFYDCFDDDYKNKCEYVLHGKTGYEILIKEGVSKKRARFALAHVGVGFEKNIPITLEEEIVCYADNFHSKGHPRFNSFEESMEEMIKINPDFGVILKRFKDKFGIPDVKELKEKYKKWHEEINEWVESVK
jgi:putative nucleotidyltransferase with HDIG domain